MSNREQIQALKRSANDYCDTLAWPTVILAAVVVPLYFVTPVAVVAGWLPVAIGMVVMALLTYAGYTALHESVHEAVPQNQALHRPTATCKNLASAPGTAAIARAALRPRLPNLSATPLQKHVPRPSTSPPRSSRIYAEFATPALPASTRNACAHGKPACDVLS